MARSCSSGERGLRPTGTARGGVRKRRPARFRRRRTERDDGWMDARLGRGSRVKTGCTRALFGARHRGPYPERSSYRHASSRSPGSACQGSWLGDHAVVTKGGHSEAAAIIAANSHGDRRNIPRSARSRQAARWIIKEKYASMWPYELDSASRNYASLKTNHTYAQGALNIY